MSKAILDRAGIATTKTKKSIPVWIETADHKLDLSQSERQWLTQVNFKCQAGQAVLLPGESGKAEKAIIGAESMSDIAGIIDSFKLLPELTYYFAETNEWAFWYCLMHGLDSYQFNVFRQGTSHPTRRLICADKSQREAIVHALAAHFTVRDLVNLPAESLGPAEMADAVKTVAQEFGGKCKAWKGNALLDNNFPLIHAVGRASHRAPQLIEMTWGNRKHPLVTIIGKGVCFDTGGLDLKPAQYMRNMKKDMGGAAHALGLAQWIMSEKLPVQIQLLIPTVDNAVAGNAFRPGDVFIARNGLSVEIDNTDAEGRLVLADALTYAAEKHPKLMIDFATLTGAARVALGTDVPVFFTNVDTLRQQIQDNALPQQETVWPLPLHQPYKKLLKSTVADIVNSAGVPYGGAITAALFLEHFIPEKQPWVHFDMMAYNLAATAGHPEGGEAMGLRTAFATIKQLAEGEQWPQC